MPPPRRPPRADRRGRAGVVAGDGCAGAAGVLLAGRASNDSRLFTIACKRPGKRTMRAGAVTARQAPWC
jgi:hypothetical protein